jgi:antitoxin (DNA-binding transcriptional repressor) of toxin-antitoxin stability system
MEVSVAVAENKLSGLVRVAEDGETMRISRHGVPAVDIVRTKKPSRKKPRLGTLKGRIHVLEPEWRKPMPDDEVEAFGPPNHRPGRLRKIPVVATRNSACAKNARSSGVSLGLASNDGERFRSALTLTNRLFVRERCRNWVPFDL